MDAYATRTAAYRELPSSVKQISINAMLYDTIGYDSVYLTCSKKLTGNQLSLPHGINKKLKCETKNNELKFHILSRDRKMKCSGYQPVTKSQFCQKVDIAP